MNDSATQGKVIPAPHDAAPSHIPFRTALVERLRNRRNDLQQSAQDRIRTITEPGYVATRTYLTGLDNAVSVALDHSFNVLAESRKPPEIPSELLDQAGNAARLGVPLEVVLRRYLIGYTLVENALIEEAYGIDGMDGKVLTSLLHTYAAHFDQLISAVSAAHRRGWQTGISSSDNRLAIVRSLLADEDHVDPSSLAYNLDAWHVGLVASGRQATEAITALAHTLDRIALLVHPGDSLSWAWLGGRTRLDLLTLDRALTSHWPPHTPLAVGEVMKGIRGWRLTHRQAAATFPVALRHPDSQAHYAHVAIPTSALRDDLLRTSLQHRYLAPLTHARDGGTAFRDTLRAYFSKGGNTSAAAAALGVHRQTVTNRIRAIEERLGCPVDSCAMELGLALRLDEWGIFADADLP